MDALKAIGIGVGVVVLVLLVSPFLIQSMVRGSDRPGAGSMGIIGELFHPGQHEMTVQLQSQAEKGEDADAGQGDDPEDVEASEDAAAPTSADDDLPWELRG